MGEERYKLKWEEILNIPTEQTRVLSRTSEILSEYGFKTFYLPDEGSRTSEIEIIALRSDAHYEMPLKEEQVKGIIEDAKKINLNLIDSKILSPNGRDLERVWLRFALRNYDRSVSINFGLQPEEVEGIGNKLTPIEDGS